jgi:peptidoglycan-associated lipoprotein
VDSVAIRDSIMREQRAQAQRDSVAREERIRRVREDSVRRVREDSIRRVREETESVRVMIARTIHFDFDKSSIRPGEDTDVLQEKLGILQANPSLRLQITGHADERGSDEYNLALGNRRALSAKQFLIDRGIDESRIEVRSKGESEPLDPRSNEEAWALNRRDEFQITGGGDVLKRPSGM